LTMRFILETYFEGRLNGCTASFEKGADLYAFHRFDNSVVNFYGDCIGLPCGFNSKFIIHKDIKFSGKEKAANRCDYYVRENSMRDKLAEFFYNIDPVLSCRSSIHMMEDLK
ncbi:MAG TPA: hypothetical protein VEC16_06905, partial [Alphaproteobacteria bacterium]|nr:hypothetical protein [Alphaproteobacteria bacterium]